jgi:hypothetical protein
MMLANVQIVFYMPVKNVKNIRDLVVFMTQNPYKKWQIALLKSKNLFVGKNSVLMSCRKGFIMPGCVFSVAESGR